MSKGKYGRKEKISMIIQTGKNYALRKVCAKLVHLTISQFTMAKRKIQNVCMCITCKQIELENPSWSGFEFATKPDH